MRSVKFLVAAGAASLLSSAAFAADMPSIMPPPQPYYAPPPAQDFGGWYLRGDIGMTNTSGKLHSNLDDALPAGTAIQQFDQGFTGGMPTGSVSAISSTTGSVPISPVNIAPRSTSPATT